MKDVRLYAFFWRMFINVVILITSIIHIVTDISNMWICMFCLVVVNILCELFFLMAMVMHLSFHLSMFSVKEMYQQLKEMGFEIDAFADTDNNREKEML